MKSEDREQHGGWRNMQTEGGCIYFILKEPEPLSQMTGGLFDEVFNE